LRIQAHGVNKECVDAILGKSLAVTFAQSACEGLDCLIPGPHELRRSRIFPGTIDETTSDATSAG